MQDSPLQIKIKRLSPEFHDVPLPAYSTEDASCMDIRAAIAEDVTLRQGEFVLIPTNLTVEIPSGYELQVRPRSGLAAKQGVTVLNTPGTIDADYRGEIKVIMINHGKDEFIIKRGDRIAQILPAPVLKAVWDESADLEDTARGKGGFGHTGQS